jgi:hypothetical protein
MLITFDLVSVVRAFVKTIRAFHNVSRPDTRLATRQIGEENLFRLTLLARETKIPLSGG